MRPLPITEKGGVLVIRLGGSSAFDEGEAAAVRQSLYSTLAARPYPRVALDLGGIDYISSTGIALLIGTKRRVDAAQGQVVLFGLHPDNLELFGTMRLTALFQVVATEDEALSLFPKLPAS